MTGLVGLAQMELALRSPKMGLLGGFGALKANVLWNKPERQENFGQNLWSLTEKRMTESSR